MKFNLGIGALSLLVLAAWASCSWACEVDLNIGDVSIGCAPREEKP